MRTGIPKRLGRGGVGRVLRVSLPCLLFPEWCGRVLDGLIGCITGYIGFVLYEASFVEALFRSIVAVMGLAVAAGGVVAVMGFLSGRD